MVWDIASTKQQKIRTFADQKVCTPQAVTSAETSYLLARLITQCQQLLTLTAGKCDSSDQKTRIDCPFGSVQCM